MTSSPDATNPDDAAADAATPDAAPDAAADIIVYWRPGCPFCGMLFRQLERSEIAHTRVNIWDDPDAAAVVRSIARGNETVPTVVVASPAGDRVGLVNPSVDQILAAASA